MKAAGGLALLALAACGREPEPTNNAATIQPAQIGQPAQIATPQPVPSPSPSLAREVGEPAVPVPGARRPTTSLPEGPFAADSGQAGADVVQTYVALIAEGRVRQALELWEPGAAAPTAASFERYREFHANVGGPGRVEGAAGSRYVTVPVHFYGTLKSGGRFVEDGAITLRRSGEVDGATAEQKRWRIYSAEVTPAPPRR